MYKKLHISSSSICWPSQKQYKQSFKAGGTSRVCGLLTSVEQPWRAKYDEKRTTSKTAETYCNPR